MCRGADVVVPVSWCVECALCDEVRVCPGQSAVLGSSDFLLEELIGP